MFRKNRTRPFLFGSNSRPIATFFNGSGATCRAKRSILLSLARTQRVCGRRMRAQPPAGFQGDAPGGKLEGRSSPDFPLILRSVAMQESRLKRFGYSFSEAVICVLVNLIFEHFDFIHGFRVLDHVIAATKPFFPVLHISYVR